MMEENKKYGLFLREEKYRDVTRCSQFFSCVTNREKTTGPFNYNGCRYKLNFLTGEMRLYTRQEYNLIAYVSVARSKRLLNMLLLMNDFDWFCTLTFDKDKINRANDDEIYKVYVKYIHNIKQQFPTLRYITVLERHKDKTIHFHMLIGGVSWQKLGLVNSGKVCAHWATKKNGMCSKEYFNRTKHLYELKDTDGLTVYNISSFIYGFTTATRIVSREKCNTYIKKYMDKAFGSTDVFKKRFYYSSNLNVPEVVEKCVGADFNHPEDIEHYVKDNPIFQHAKDVCVNSKFNVALCTIDNDLKENIDKGLLPCDIDDTPF